jgi:hypothetical protein
LVGAGVGGAVGVAGCFSGMVVVELHAVPAPNELVSTGTVWASTVVAKSRFSSLHTLRTTVSGTRVN